MITNIVYMENFNAVNKHVSRLSFRNLAFLHIHLHTLMTNSHSNRPVCTPLKRNISAPGVQCMYILLHICTFIRKHDMSTMQRHIAGEKKEWEKRMTHQRVALSKRLFARVFLWQNRRELPLWRRQRWRRRRERQERRCQRRCWR